MGSSTVQDLKAVVRKPQHTLNVNQSLRVGETLVSSSGTFELGFFSPGSSGNCYLGKWYRNISVRTVIWVANRDTPIRDTTGVTLKVIQPGILAILNSKDSVIWSSNTSRSLRNPVAQLLGYGNFVVREANDGRPENFVWQSFDHPTDTYLPGMRFGWNYVTGLETYLLSWRGVDDPARGDYSFHLDPTGFPQIVLKRGNVVTYRLGNWNGVRFSGAVNPRDATSNGLVLVMNENEVSYVRSPSTSLLSRVTINLNGVVQRLRWVDGRGWMANLNMPADICDTYRLCGANGICNFGNSTPCRCLDRFVPRDPEGWERTDWENGCDRRRKLSCEGDVFFRYSGIKLPDARYSWHNTSMMLDECRHECLTNCSCTAYTQLDIERRIGCIFWFRGLIDVRSVSLNGQDIYIRMASSDPDSDGKNRKILIASMTSGIGAVLIGLGLFIYIRKRKNDSKVKEAYDGSYFKDLELPLFDLSVVLTATDHFSFSNKIGEGGFCHVYKGMLEGGLEIAVKRMSKDSMQGLTELKNEGVFIAKLQHRNLVRLLGCCIQGEESMLVYEYMPNKSLDVLLFDNRKRMQLDWPKRFQIINGIARGLLYLHQDSRLRIIHRDLKASNVLLDSEMNPKISDFGIARSFVGNELEAAKTRRVVGTYGYMAPEYAVDGFFSVKSDVFSFGVLVLEIVSGMRNRGFVHNNHSLNLLGHAWTLYREGRSMDLVDACLSESLNSNEVERSIHVGLLCVQEKTEDRPSMSYVVQMFSNESELLQAKQPGFFTERDVCPGRSSTSTNAANATNLLTITLPEGR